MAIADESGEWAFLPKALAPHLELLWRLASALAKVGDVFLETMRVEVGQSRTDECCMENLANSRSLGPKFAGQILFPVI